MSYDRQLEQLCTHLVAEEYLLMRGDRQVATPLRPIASSNSVVIRANGVAKIPSYGVETPAQSSGSRSGPFTITAGVNDRLRVRVGSDAWQDVRIPSGYRIQPDHLALSINTRVNGLQFYTQNNKMLFRSNLLGRNATVFLDSTSTLATLLGIPVARYFSGKKVFPGWALVNKTGTLTDRPLRLIVFDEPLQADLNFLEVNYTTVREECRRCGGLGVENDWRYNVTGEVTQVRDEILLIQELQKIIYTIAGTNSFHSWYGTRIIDQIGEKLVVGGILQNRITSDIYTAFGRWQDVKKQQEELVGQAVSDEEFPFQLQGVKLEQSQDDPTVLFITVTVSNRSLKPIQLTRGLRLPYPNNLLGATAQQEIVSNLQKYSLVQ
jgi:hypothetical protein